MDEKPSKKFQRGQSLVEYAMILVLVSVVVVVAASTLGVAVQRIYAVVAGSLGVKKDAGVISIDFATCYVESSTHRTGIIINGTTSENVSTIEIVSAPALVGWDGTLVTVTDTGSGTFTINPTLSNDVADQNLCPPSIVLQSKDGATAIWPISLEVS